MIPLPFLIVAVDRRNYLLRFSVNTFSAQYRALDSVSYQLYDPHQNLLSKGKVIALADQFAQMLKYNFYYPVVRETEDTLTLARSLQKNLYINLALHLQDTTGNSVTEEYRQILQKETPKRVRVHLMGN
ncbi:hypothetical protein [Rufibacter sp. XAAS-G3-1]|uniref:hypothetical protein n=1 Tax=Rufibacter sp. XAAS-G3-1 TaxID=2729134 RepID=UPI0015E75D61|nr:hypothetical protein [Rufibacter sp. XAAS-G3-1]